MIFVWIYYLLMLVPAFRFCFRGTTSDLGDRIDGLEIAFYCIISASLAVVLAPAMPLVWAGGALARRRRRHQDVDYAALARKIGGETRQAKRERLEAKIRALEDENERLDRELAALGVETR